MWLGAAATRPRGLGATAATESESRSPRDTASRSGVGSGTSRNISRKWVSIGVDGRPIRGSKYDTNGAKNAGSSNSASTRSSSAGSRSNSCGSIDSNNAG